MADRNLVNFTITISKEERKILRQIALDEDTSVSALVRGWIQAYIMDKTVDENEHDME